MRVVRNKISQLSETICPYSMGELGNSGGVYSGRGYLHIRPVPELFLKEKGYHQKTYVVLKVLGFKLSVAMRSLVFPSGLFKRTESMGSAAARWRSCPYLFVVCSSLRNRSKLLDRI